MFLSAERSVLVVVDVQQRLAPAMPALDRVLARLDLLLTTAAATRVGGWGPPGDPDRAVPEGARTYAACRRAGGAGRDGWVEKTAFGACGEPAFVDAVRRQRPRPRRRSAGQGGACLACLQTALGLSAAGVETVLLRDACASRRDVDHGHRDDPGHGGGRDRRHHRDGGSSSGWPAPTRRRSRRSSRR